MKSRFRDSPYSLISSLELDLWFEQQAHRSRCDDIHVLMLDNHQDAHEITHDDGQRITADRRRGILTFLLVQLVNDDQQRVVFR